MSSMNKHNQDKYVVDANILINFGTYTPRNVHKTFWSRMEEAVDDGKMIIIKEVADECSIGDIEIWLDEQSKAGRIVEVEQEILARAAVIDKKYHIVTEELNRKTGMTVIKSAADPVIIAYAENKKHIVFTREVPRRRKKGEPLVFSKERPGKIPDVCNKLGVTCFRSPAKVLKKVIQPI